MRAIWPDANADSHGDINTYANPVYRQMLTDPKTQPNCGAASYSCSAPVAPAATSSN